MTKHTTDNSIYSSILSSIHPFSIRVQVAGVAVLAELLRPPFPLSPPPAPPGECQASPRPAKRYNHCTMSWDSPRVSSQLDMPKTPPVGVVQVQMPEPPQIAPFDFNVNMVNV